MPGTLAAPHRIARQVLPLVLVPGLSCGPGCASSEYVFGVAGQVLDGRGKPVPGARVTLRTDRPVYETITPIRSRAVEADRVGWFAFVYTTHHLPTPYVLVVEKQGCTAREVSGVAPPSQEHSITLDCHVTVHEP